MQKLNQLVNNRINNLKIPVIFFFSFLPISIIIGNAAVNINIIIINIFFLFYCYKYNHWVWLKNKTFLYLILIYLFLIFNSIYSFYFIVEDEVSGLVRSVLFIKFILLVFAFLILLDDSLLDKILKNWLIISVLVILDVLFEKWVGHNLIGFKSPDPARAASFFKDELVVGGYIFCFGYASLTYLLQKDLKKKYFLFLAIILLIIPLTIFLTGERSNFIKSFLLFFTIIFFLKKNEFFFNHKNLLVIFIISLSLLILLNNNSKNRYFELYKRIQIVEPNTTILEKLENIRYIAHFDAAIKMFKSHPVSGVGNKNYRKECSKDVYYEKKIKFSEQRCSTHPHQIHFEILSEQGLLGYIIIIYFITMFLVKNIKVFLQTKNVFHLSNIAYLTLFLMPILPGGGIFSTFNGSTFWIIFSLCNRIYEKK